MEEKISVLPDKRTIFNLQKLKISDQSVLQSKNGRYAVVKDSNNTSYLCQIFIQKLLHPSYCIIDKSVCFYDHSNYKKLFPLTNTLDYISLSNIQIIESVENIKSVFVSIVFKTPLDVKNWTTAKTKLSDLVKNILKLFILKANSVVSLDGIKQVFRTEISFILIESLGNVNVGCIVNSSKVRLKQLMSKTTFEQLYTSCEELPLLGGLDHPLETLYNLLKIAGNKELHHPIYKQVLIAGPPGCGKTAMVRRAARDCGCVVRTVVGPELSSPLPGEAEQALTRVFQECRLLAQESPAGCVLLLDQVDSLCGRRDSSSEGHLVRLSNQLFALLETVGAAPGLVVVGTTNRPHLLDPAVRRPGRFDHEIHISVSSEHERASIVSAITRQLGMSAVVSEQVAQWTPGFVGADLALLAANVARQMEKQGLNLSHDVAADILPVWQACVGQLRPSCLRGGLGVVAPLTAPPSLAGLDDVHRCLSQAIQWPLTHADAFTRMGLPQPKGVLLFGPPGCAKTSLVRAIASATNTTFLAVSAAEVYSPYVGDAERTIAELFHRARIGAPTVLFIDEIDALVGCRGNRERGSQERILTAFLTEMDGIGVRLDSGITQAAGGVVVVAATNRPGALDPALTRPGRFDRLVYVGPPDTPQRLAILQTLTRKMPLADDVDLNTLAQQTKLFSGADLAQLCKEAGLSALAQEGMSVAQVSWCHWRAALGAVRPSLTPAQLEQYTTFPTSH